MGLRDDLVARAARTPSTVLAGGVFMNLGLALSLFVIAALIQSLILLVAGAWLLLPAATNAYMLFVDRDRSF
jgi:hypothetical protein